MSIFRAVIDREIGITSPFYYDSLLSRLAVEYYVPSSQKSPFFPAYSCEFAETPQYRHYVAIGDQRGNVLIYDATKNNETRIVTEYRCHNAFINDIAWMPIQTHFVTVSGDPNVKLWDIGTGDILQVREFQNHVSEPLVAAFRPDDCSVFATGFRNGRILIWDTRCDKDVLTITTPVTSIDTSRLCIAQRTRSSFKTDNPLKKHVNGLTFQDDNTLLSCGMRDRTIRVWDLRKRLSCHRDPMHSFGQPRRSIGKGYSNFILDRSNRKLYAVCLDSNIYCYNVGTYADKPEHTYKGLKVSHFIKPSLSPDGKYLLSPNMGEKAYIWNVNKPNPIVELSGHKYRVCSVAWSQLEKTTLIVTNSLDKQPRIWTIGKEVGV